jgi:putative ATP-dependent endonuclease of the OLD family
MRIKQVEIKNFRGVNSLQWILDEPLVCLIGAGDSSKSTMIDAIEYVLSPNWFIPIDDSDFYNCNINNPIIIRVTIKPTNEDLWIDSKFGLCLRGWDIATKTIVDDPSDDDNLEKVITLQLTIDDSLSPDWRVVTDRKPEGDSISFKDRQKLGVSRIGNNISSELSWSRGSALSRLTPDKADAEKIILEANRDLRERISDEPFKNLDESIAIIKDSYEELGLDIEDLKASIDPETIRSKLGALSLHQNNNVPARKLGLGSRRLLAIAAQLQCVNQGSIMLIDEIETALEPHKIKHLLRVLKNKTKEENSGQFIFTSHHVSVIEELGCGPLFSVIKRNDDIKVNRIPSSIQGTVRNLPEALLAPKVIICEGATEMGLLRAYENKLLETDIKQTMAYNQVAIVNAGGGSNVAPRAYDLKSIDKKVCVFMDSDCTSYIPNKDSGVEIIAWKDEMYTENRVVSDLPNNLLIEFIKLAIKEKSEQAVVDKINSFIPDPADKLVFNGIEAYSDIDKLKQATATAASDGSWFKSVNGGEVLGKFLFNDNVFQAMQDTDFFDKMNQLERWINA